MSSISLGKPPLRPARKITLCGSTRFRHAYETWALLLTLEGYIVYSIPFCGHAEEGVDHPRAEKAQLEATHMVKILNSDEIFVLNVGGYIGETTERQIAFAKLLGKGIRYLPESVTKRAEKEPA